MTFFTSDVGDCFPALLKKVSAVSVVVMEIAGIVYDSLVERVFLKTSSRTKPIIRQPMPKPVMRLKFFDSRVFLI
jgi:hypothetical protein